ncbi:Por secretion system C-terminal sorting domain-containing protein [Pustulibacterium marinum]|uniref:Por secretion system C-terminal sorting domain-containing protein n=1 Tax=Pustulibacterium marinum TaxID=1224947 RepID=A0A1I7FBP6_9FLAO|nr:T9SS type A sorting domain-containing protein [Pustulibacterium marinum]SFU33683.1 Por secretion system C-terminal sorting domain-containing protein [Pustulibacterium marinum]
MKKIFTLLSFFALLATHAQLRVDDGSFIYVKDTYVFVEQDIDLESNGNIYLRDGSQILQGESNSTNTGNGAISVLQEGNATSYSYNYWSSPVKASGGSAFIPNQVLFERSADTTGSSAAFTTSYNGSADPLTISSSWIYKYVTGTAYANWVYVGSAGSVDPGYGFTMKGVATSASDTDNLNQEYDFRGIPNNGTININVLNGEGVLIGNPYPSALDLNAFLTDSDNTEVNATAYFWQQDMSVNSHNLADYLGGYATYTPAGGFVQATYNSYDSAGNLVSSSGNGQSSNTNADYQYAAIGQGFTVTGSATGTISFKNSHRAYMQENAGSSVFYRVANDNTTATPEETSNNYTKFILQVVVNDTYTRDLMLGVDGNTTLGYDFGFDGALSSTLQNDAGFDILGNPYAIQFVSNDDSSILVPLHLISNGNTSFEVLIGQYINTNSDQDLYIYDSLLDEYHAINGDTSFTFNTNGSSIGDRYYVTFSDNSALSTDPVVASSDILVHQNNSTKSLLIKNPNSLNFNSVVLHDISGKRIFNELDLGTESEYTFNTSNLSTGVYLVTINTVAGQSITKKISIRN